MADFDTICKRCKNFYFTGKTYQNPDFCPSCIHLEKSSYTEWGVSYRGIYIYESEEEARRQLELACMDVPAILVKRQISEWEETL